MIPHGKFNWKTRVSRCHYGNMTSQQSFYFENGFINNYMTDYI